jgi:hypothetical protein
MHDELFEPYERLVEIQIQGRVHQVPENNTLLRCFQYVCMEDVSCGRFCWNQECKTCAIGYELESGEPKTGLCCETMVVEGMKILKISKELRWALRSIVSGLNSELCTTVLVEDDTHLGQ